MKSIKYGLFCLLVLALAVEAQIPKKINYQAKITNPDGIAIEGATGIKFSLYTAPAGGPTLWSDSLVVDVSHGLFDVTLGPILLDFDQQYWMELKVESETLGPRQPLNAVPYAIYSTYSLGSDTAVYARFAIEADTALNADWFDLYNIPAGFADGVDDTGHFAGFTGDTFVAQWDSIRDIPAGFADGIDDTCNLAGFTGDTFVAQWDSVRDIPEGFADGNDDTNDLDVNRIRSNANPWLQGDVTLQEGTNVNLGQAGNNITINATGDGEGITSINGMTGPAFSIDAGTGISVTNGTNTVTIDNDGVLSVNGNTGNVNLATLTRGNGLSGANYNGSTPTTWAVVYGNSTNTAVQGNAAWSVTAGNGLTGDASGVLGNGLSSTINLGDGTGYTPNVNNFSINLGAGLGFSGDNIVNTGDLSTTNECNTSVTWNNTSNTISVTDPCGTVNAVITGYADGTGAANKVTYWTDPTTISYHDDFHFDDVTVRLGIGTDTPENKVHAETDYAEAAVYGYNSNDSTVAMVGAHDFGPFGQVGAPSYGLYGTDGVFAGFVGGPTRGVEGLSNSVWGYLGGARTGAYGFSDSANGYGVLGSGDSAATGVMGFTTSSTAFGVRAFNGNTSGTGLLASGDDVTPSYFIEGSGIAASGHQYAVVGFGDNDSAGTTGSYTTPGLASIYGEGPKYQYLTGTNAYRYGVYGDFPDYSNSSYNSAGVIGVFSYTPPIYGGLAHVDSSGRLSGVYGRWGPAGTYAGYFDGPVIATINSNTNWAIECVNDNTTGIALSAFGGGTSTVPTSGNGDGIATVTDENGYAVVASHYNGVNYNRWGYIGGSSNGVYGRTDNTNGFGVYGSNSHTLGTGVLGVGNGTTSYSAASGSGGAFTGYSLGVYGYATMMGNNSQAGGYFENAAGGYAYCGYRGTSGTNYKTIGSGTNSTIVEDNQGNLVTLFCPEAPEVLFEDYGEGKLIEGHAHIDLDPVFAKNITVNEKHPLRVFVQLLDNPECKGVVVTNRSAAGFDVIELMDGKSNTNFTWHVVGNRADEPAREGKEYTYYEDVRFPPAPGPLETKEYNKKESDIKKPILSGSSKSYQPEIIEISPKTGEKGKITNEENTGFEKSGKVLDSRKELSQ
ncbi:hypothetical protein JXI42_13100 [bacterium]|nr:hypothetical protein [bacterium]